MLCIQHATYINYRKFQRDQIREEEPTEATRANPTMGTLDLIRKAV